MRNQICLTLETFLASSMKLLNANVALRTRDSADKCQPLLRDKALWSHTLKNSPAANANEKLGDTILEKYQPPWQEIMLWALFTMFPISNNQRQLAVSAEAINLFLNTIKYYTFHSLIVFTFLGNIEFFFSNIPCWIGVGTYSTKHTSSA